MLGEVKTTVRIWLLEKSFVWEKINQGGLFDLF